MHFKLSHRCICTVPLNKNIKRKALKDARDTQQDRERDIIHQTVKQLHVFTKLRNVV